MWNLLERCIDISNKFSTESKGNLTIKISSITSYTYPNFIIILVGLLLTICPVDSRALEVAKYGGDYIGGVGVRGLSMGGANTAAVNDVSAGYWNPARMHLAAQKTLGIMHTESFGGTVNFDYAAMRVPTEALNLGVTLIRTGVDEIPNTLRALRDYGKDGVPNTGDQGEGNGVFDTFPDGTSERLDESAITFFNSSQYDLIVTYSESYSDKLALGASFKLHGKSIHEESAVGLGFDVGASYRWKPWLQFGALARNATTTLLAWSTGRMEVYKPEIRIGTAGNINIPPLRMQIVPTADLIYYTDGRRLNSLGHLFGASFQYAAGLEFTFSENLALRFGRSSIEEFTTGVAFSLGKARIEYGFSPSGARAELGDSHRLGLLWRF